jgi:hypothetical protein
MLYKILLGVMLACSLPSYATHSDEDKQLREEVRQLQNQTRLLQQQLDKLQHQLVKHSPKKTHKHSAPPKRKHALAKKPTAPAGTHNSPVYVHTLNGHPESVEDYPTALLSENHVVTYIAGTPVVTAPYLGSRPAYDGSDYVVNISSINRDIRLMQQRRQLYKAYRAMGYTAPNTPIVALSGKAEPIGTLGEFSSQSVAHNWSLGSAELDAAASINDKVQAYLSLAYAPLPGFTGGPNVTNSTIGLGMGFINIGDLETTPYYFTAGQIFVPFGRYSTLMVSAPLTMVMSRTKARPFIFGYKSQYESGPFAAIYGFEGDTTKGDTGVAGMNLGYILTTAHSVTEIGASFISSIDNAGGMQINGSTPSNMNFGGFSSITNGNEEIKQIPAFDIHGNFRFDRYIITTEWVTTTQSFKGDDLTFNGHGAQPQAGQLEAAATFRAFNVPASFALGYQWTREALALKLPEQRLAAVLSFSFWKDTIESLEYRHDIDYRQNQFANGAAPVGMVNTNTIGTGKSSDMVLAQIGVYF